DYLSSYMKLGTIAALVIGTVIVAPHIYAPAVSQFAGGGGPIIPGKLFPFVFITIACGAISGFHALIGSGTTPKMIDKESDARMIGDGAMLCEGLVGCVSLIAVCALHTGGLCDTGTRVARFMVQEFLGRAWKPFENTSWIPGTIASTALVVFGWTWFILNGSISQIWPMFGIANQLLAAVALCVGTTVILNAGKAKYAWTTMFPLAFVASTTLYAGYRSIFDN